MVKGESNHAGTTPMNARKDAVAVSALCISYLTNKAKAAYPLLTATVGRIEAKPNVPNVISGEAVFLLISAIIMMRCWTGIATIFLLISQSWPANGTFRSQLNRRRMRSL